jgi:hypothetical protein
MNKDWEWADTDERLARWEAKLRDVKPPTKDLKPANKLQPQLQRVPRGTIKGVEIIYRRKQLYIITNSELQPVKIGVSDEPGERLKGIQSGNWQRLHIHRVFNCPANVPYHFESILHRRLRARCLIGEWFDIHAEEATILAERVLEGDLSPLNYLTEK